MSIKTQKILSFIPIAQLLVAVNWFKVNRSTVSLIRIIKIVVFTVLLLSVVSGVLSIVTHFLTIEGIWLTVLQNVRLYIALTIFDSQLIRDVQKNRLGTE